MKNTDTAALKGYDAGKKVSGIKRHIAVDTQGLPHAVAVTTAEVTDRKGALLALTRCKPTLSRVQSLLADSGYVGQPFAQGVQEILGGHVTVQIAKRSELHTFKVMPKRWIPDELVWSHAKRTGVARSPLRKGDKLKERVDAQLQSVAEDPALIRSFFRHLSVAYISDL
ncbi:hypothetical protein AVHM3334_22780 [Acidovorax sp. SUPP3334]|nr:hypothetical protein AVHM3334_22780 [Acidovorax sp. SUPP3334]